MMLLENFYPTDRQWWPFLVEVAHPHQSPELMFTLDFLNNALRPGVRPFLQNSEGETGAIADSGRECLIVKRGKQRAELILTDRGDIQNRQVFFQLDDYVALQTASSIALQWLTGGLVAIEPD